MKNKKILIIDDDKLIKELYRRISEQLGAVGIAASSILEAREKIKEESPFDLIILDLILPHSNGWEILEELKENPDTENIPVIITTGIALSGDEINKLELQSSAIVNKSTFDVNEFTELLKDLLK
jgi:CheY-like chemotaxis protein